MRARSAIEQNFRTLTRCTRWRVAIRAVQLIMSDGTPRFSMHPSSGNGAANPRDLTRAVSTARRGLRRDVRVLVEALDEGELFAPLAAKVSGAVYGEQLDIEDELKLTPHMLEDPEGKLYCALFTKPELMEPLEEELGWTTDGEPLEYCAIPARAAFDMALQVIDERDVLGLVINPLDDTELMLRRIELASIAQNQPIPLVGYVQQIPLQDSERTLVAEPGEPPPPELILSLERCLAGLPEVTGYTLRSTFNAERDLEPHLTLTLRTRGSTGLDAIAKCIVREIEDKLPPPGYIDVLFEDA